MAAGALLLRGRALPFEKGLLEALRTRYVHSGLITIGAECASGDQGRHRHHLR
jgi:hypothetical protein